jgi:transposase InsO family protein
MSRRGNPYDNAACESFMKTLKYEEVVCCERLAVEARRCFIEDGGWPSEVSLQGRASNRHKLLG